MSPSVTGAYNERAPETAHRILKPSGLQKRPRQEPQKSSNFFPQLWTSRDVGVGGAGRQGSKWRLGKTLYSFQLHRPATGGYPLLALLDNKFTKLHTVFITYSSPALGQNPEPTSPSTRSHCPVATTFLVGPLWPRHRRQGAPPSRMRSLW